MRLHPSKSFFLLCLLSLFLFPVCALGEIVLVEEGRPVATIVIADNASAQAREAAGDLQWFLYKISGASIEIESESEEREGGRILVGPSKAISDLGVEIPSGHTRMMDEEAAVLKTIGQDLILAGNEDWEYRGTILAVYTFLDDLGCRWYFPGEFGEVLPRVKTITVPEKDRVERPSFRIRHLWCSGWMPMSQEQREAFNTWYKRNRLNSLSFNLPSDGSIDRLRPNEYFETHPHLFALDKNGERTPQLLNLTEPEVVQLAAETIKRHFRENPDSLTFGFAPHDGFPIDYSETSLDAMPGFEGKGYGDPSMSDLWFSFANKIAKEVYREFPDRWVLTNGYANRVRPPEGIGELSPNLGIQSAVIAADTFHRIGDPTSWQRLLYKQILDRWTEKLDPVVIYDYDPGKALDNLPFPALHNLRYDLPYFRDRGVWGFYTEGSHCWMVTHLNYYVRAKLMWNADTDVDGLVREYCSLFYEEAAQPVEQYIWTLEKAVEETPVLSTWGRLVPWRLILGPVREELDTLIEEAKRLATNSDPFLKKRIHLLGLVHDHMNAYIEMEEELAAGDFSKAVEWTGTMMSIRNEAEALEPGMLPHTPEWAHNFRTTIEWHRDIYKNLAAKAGGEQGELVEILPKDWAFKTDPEDIGVIYQWYEEAIDDSWTSLDTTLPWEWQGYSDEKGWAYWGKAWYRTRFEVPEEAIGKPLWLTIGAVYNRGVWIWMNGELQQWRKDKHWRLGHHDVRTPIHIDVTESVRPGRNEIAVLVNTEMPGRNTRSGIHRRSFLWAPRDTK